jgi:hypothetical protein
MKGVKAVMLIFEECGCVGLFQRVASVVQDVYTISLPAVFIAVCCFKMGHLHDSQISP